MKSMNSDDFRVVDKIELSKIPTELNNDADGDQKKAEFLKIQQKSLSKINDKNQFQFQYLSLIFIAIAIDFCYCNCV